MLSTACYWFFKTLCYIFWITFHLNPLFPLIPFPTFVVPFFHLRYFSLSHFTFFFIIWSSFKKITTFFFLFLAFLFIVLSPKLQSRPVVVCRCPISAIFIGEGSRLLVKEVLLWTAQIRTNKRKTWLLWQKRTINVYFFVLSITKPPAAASLKNHAAASANPLLTNLFFSSCLFLYLFTCSLY